jgi:hypothetical protein
MNWEICEIRKCVLKMVFGGQVAVYDFAKVLSQELMAKHRSTKY